ncbi:serine hydrolase domain-containing protein [Glutamicibacter mysorens]|uniref:serine hydrolase domain-containing protein n=1 Tax=Glutamicibacter mysorens TaxID=257984 RepID=UPI0020C731E2|nr:serine hydrolase [Glutamicibacter mysorens]UTM46315.1 beta-lactamase family protein [Glutamicibacter mysorens]
MATEATDAAGHMAANLAGPPSKALNIATWQYPQNIKRSFQNIARIHPTVKVSRGDGPIVRLHLAEEKLGKLEVAKASITDPALTVRGVMHATNTDAVLVMHNGRILWEKYYNTMTSLTDHLLMSVSKTLVGSLAGALVDAGKLDTEQTVTTYVPALERSGYAGARVRDLLDMRSGIRFSEEYLDPQAEVRQLEEAIGWAPQRGGIGPIGMYEFLLTLEAKGPHGSVFEYRSCETDALGWVLEAAGGAPMQELLSDYVWSKLGAQQDLVMGVDQFGTGMFDGGFNACLRDLARFGHLYVNGGRALTGKQVLSEEWIADTFIDDPALVQAFAQSPGDNMMPGGHYRNQIWFPNPATGAAVALGIHGQMIYMDPATKLVAVKLSSWPLPQDASKLFPTIRAFEAISAHLAERKI